MLQWRICWGQGGMNPREGHQSSELRHGDACGSSSAGHWAAQELGKETHLREWWSSYKDQKPYWLQQNKVKKCHFPLIARQLLTQIKTRCLPCNHVISPAVCIRSTSSHMPFSDLNRKIPVCWTLLPTYDTWKKKKGIETLQYTFTSGPRKNQDYILKYIKALEITFIFTLNLLSSFNTAFTSENGLHFPPSLPGITLVLNHPCSLWHH